MDPAPGFGELIALAEQGDKDAVRRILDEYGDAIRREIRFCLLDQRLRQVVAESDVYQSVAIRFLTTLQTGACHFEGPRDLIQLLKCIARARVARAARFWFAQRRNIGRNRYLLQTDGFHSSAMEPGDQVADAELYHEALCHLSPQERDVIEWRVEGLDWSEIAGKTRASSPEAARKKHERALVRVALELSPQD